MLERTVKTTDALGNETNTTYDAMGRVSTVSGKIDGGDSVTAYTYDGNGNVIKESVTSNKPGETTAYRNTYYQYDSMNRLIKTNTDEPGETLYEYDDNGNITKMTTGAVNGAGGVSTTYEYDSQNRLVKTTDPMGYTETYTYDNNGNIASMTDKNGTVTTNTYNAVNSLLTSVAGNETISYTYKPYSGQQSAVTNSSGTISYTYNTKGQLTGETSTAENAAKTYTYDKDGNQTNITVTKNNNQIINQTASYNYVGDMTSVYDNKEEKTLANYSYDGNGNMIEKKTADGMHKTVYDYNESNLLTKVENMTIYDKETNQFGSYSSYEYEYYLDGNRLKETENTGKNKEYTYDGAGRLLTESIASKDQENKIQTVYEYDARGNRISKESISYGVSLMEWTGPRPSYDDGEGYTSYWYDDNNRLTGIKYDYDEYMNEDIDYTYDNNGNMIGRERVIYYDDFPPIGSSYEEYEVESEEFEYNDFSQLIGYDSEENDIRNGTIKETTASYAYDGKGQRVKKTLNGKTIEYVWDGSGNIIGENEKVYSRGAGGEIVSDGENYYAYNGHGDTTNLVQMSSGTAIALTATYEYDAFGNLINGSETGETRENSFRYNSQYTDDETGLIYLRNRYYDPSIGRFTQEDPAKDGANWYVYCGNNPVAFVDPLGLWMDGDENLSSQAQLYTTYYGNKWDEANNIYNRCLRAGNLEGAAEAQKMMDELHNLANDIRSLDAEGKVFGAWFKGITDIDQQKRNICYAAVSLMIYNWATGSNYTYDDAVAYDQAYLEFNDKETEGGKVPNNINIRNVQYDPDSEYVGIVASKIQEAQLPLAAEFNAFEKGVQQDMGHVVLLSGAAYAPGHDPIVDFIDSAELSFDGIYTLKEFESLPSATSMSLTTYELRQITVPSIAGIKSYIDMIGEI